MCWDIPIPQKIIADLALANNLAVSLISLGEIPYDEPVYKILSPTKIIKAHSNSELKEKGFTKLVKRDSGVYENVTAMDGESRYMVSNDSSSLPHFNKKIRD